MLKYKLHCTRLKTFCHVTLPAPKNQAWISHLPGQMRQFNTIHGVVKKTDSYGVINYQQQICSKLYDEIVS